MQTNNDQAMYDAFMGKGEHGKLPILVDSDDSTVILPIEVKQGDECLMTFKPRLWIGDGNTVFTLEMTRENLQLLHEYLGKMLVKDEAVNHG